MRVQIVEKCANAAASGVDNPLVVTGIVFVSVFGISSVIDCFFGTEGTYCILQCIVLYLM